VAKKAAAISWDDNRPVKEKVEQLTPLLEKMREIEGYENDGVPFKLRFLMYSGDRVYRPLIRLYVAQMQQGFVKPAKYKLESVLKGAKGEDYYAEWQLLRTYLMLSDVENLDVEWATGHYTSEWAEINKALSDVAVVDMKKMMRPLVQHYFELIKPDGETKPRATAVPAHAKIVERTRKVLQGVPVRKRYYAFFVDSLIHEKYDPAGDSGRANRKYPPVTLDTLFTDRPEVLKWLLSKQKENPDKKKYLEVTGPYTEKGHFAVLANLKEAETLLKSEAWVVPLTDEERGDRVAANIAKLAEDYEQQYITQWKAFLRDLEVKSPANLKEAIQLFGQLQEPEWPYLRVLRTLEDHTQWKRDLKKMQGGDAATKIINRKLNRALSKRTRGLRFNVDVKKIAGKVSRVPNTFKQTVGVGVPQDSVNAPLNETRLAQYMEMLGTVREKMVQKLDENENAAPQVVGLELKNAVKQCEALLQPTDEMARATLLPLLIKPLDVAGKILPPNLRNK
jgi:type VI secretion system protein ImpL